MATAHAAAALSFSAACVHGSVMVSHFREYVLFGLFFAIVTPLQITWAELVRRAPQARRLLAAGAFGNAAVVVVWLVSRTVGLPFGPQALETEAVGFKDLLATYAELMIVVLVAALLWQRSARPVPGWTLAVAWAVAAVGLVAALVGGGH